MLVLHGRTLGLWLQTFPSGFSFPLSLSKGKLSALNFSPTLPLRTNHGCQGTVEAIRPPLTWPRSLLNSTACRHIVGKFWCLAITCLYVDMPMFSKRKYSQYYSMLNIGTKQLVCLCNFVGNRLPYYTSCTSDSIFLMTFSKETSL